MTRSFIFITGASGFIGSQVVLDTLKAGHRARPNARRESQIHELRARFSPAASDPITQLDFVINPDLSNSNAIVKCLHNVDYIFHMASPMPGAGTDFKTEYLAPAVKSTKAILEAAEKVESIKRVVITSSLLALMPLSSLAIPGYVVKEGANPSIEVHAEMAFLSGAEGSGAKYSASKILAHRATIDWVRTRQPGFDLITLHPTFVVGYDHTMAALPCTPSGTEAQWVSAKSLTASGEGGDVALHLKGSGQVNNWVLDSLASGTPRMPGQFVDVRDVSKAHLGSLGAALELDRGRVTEVLLPGPKMNWEAVVRAVQDWEGANPGVIVNKLVTGGKEGTYPEPFVVEEKSREKALTELGIGEWIGVGEMIGALLDQVRDLRV